MLCYRPKYMYLYAETQKDGIHKKSNLSLFNDIIIRNFMTTKIVCLFLARQPPMGQGLPIHEVSRSHTTTHHSR